MQWEFSGNENRYQEKTGHGIGWQSSWPDSKEETAVIMGLRNSGVLDWVMKGTH